MIDIVKNWYNLKLSDPHAITLIAVIAVSSLILYFAGYILAPIIIALILAFLLDWPVTTFLKYGIPRHVAASVVLVLFFAIVMFLSIVVLPNIGRQGLALLSEMPAIFEKINHYLLTFSQQYPYLMSKSEVNLILNELKSFSIVIDSQKIFKIGQSIISISTSFMIILIYAILVPLLVFFFLKDKTTLIRGMIRFFPKNRVLMQQVWLEMNQQILNYIRGKIIEIIIIGMVSYVFFSLMNLRYPALLSVLNGFSVLIPYVGATLVTIPIALVAFIQFQFEPQFTYIMLGYFIIQILDGNVLVPLLFAEAVDLHPVVIIAAILFFGGLWGVLGVFFAIPLASLLKVIIEVWPTHDFIEVSVEEQEP
jgi:putative permease